jgi:ABC-type nitrate/sulfonate/bicarbonate transport system permease component
MPAVPAGYGSGGQANKPSCFDRVKVGFTMGFTVGMVTGIVFGGFTALRYFINEYFLLKRYFVFL